MNAQTSKTDQEKQQLVIDAIRDQIQFLIESKEAKAEKARDRVKMNENSDWALMEDLADAYGWAPMIWKIKSVIENVEDGRFDLEAGLERFRQSLLSDLLMIRTANSSSSASNLIAEHKLEALQKTYELVTGWLIPLEAAKPASN